MQLIDDSITEKNNSNRDKFSISQEYIDLYLFRSDNINKRLEKLMLIPTLSAKTTSFALIDNDDYKKLSREFKNNGPFSIDDYRKKLFMMASRKGRESIEITVINDNQLSLKSIVAIK